MQLGSLVFLMRATGRGRRLRQAAMAAALALGTFALGLAIGGGFGAVAHVQAHFDALAPEQRVVLRRGSIDAAWFRVGLGPITGETADRVAAVPGVRRVSPEAAIRFPISGTADLLGQAYQSDISAAGVEAWVLGEDAPPDFGYDPESDTPIPAVLSTYFLDLYNMGLAASNNLPKFSESALAGRRFELILGVSTFSGRLPEGTAARRVQCVIAGLTPNPDLFGLTLPLGAVRAFNEEYGQRPDHYEALHVELEAPEAMAALEAALPELGLVLHDPLGPWRQALVAGRMLATAFAALGALVFVLAVGYMAAVLAWMLTERQKELALYQAVGATPAQVAGLVVWETGALAGLGIAIGLGAAALVLAWAGAWYAAWATGRSFLPGQLFDPSAGRLIALGIACWAAAIAVAMLRCAHGMRAILGDTLRHAG